MEVNEEPLDEWRDIMLSPKGLFMGSISEPYYFTKSVPDMSSCVESTVWADDFPNVDVPVLNSEIKMENDEDVDSYKINPSGLNGRSIAERRNVKFDLNGWGINSNNNNYYNDTSSNQRFRSCSPLASPAPDQSPCLTIPSGISPTALLDSPIMLSNSQLSPTTGTLASPSRDKPMFSSESLSFDKDDDDDDRSSLGFKPPVNAIPFSYYSTLQSQAAPYPNHLAQCSADYHNHDAAERNMDFKSPPNSTMQLDSTAMRDNNTLFQPTRLYGLPAEESRIDNAVDPVAACPPQQNHRGSYPSVGASKTSEDGYNWRKYGQKQVKGSEFPRSYYKCTYADCLVKKKVERSHDGEITEIIYKGAHNHPKPQPSRRSGPSAISCVEWNENGEGKGKGDGCSSGWGDAQNGYEKDTRLGADGLEMTSCTSVVTEISDPCSNNQGKAVGMLDSAETPELSSTLASHDDEVEDDAAEGSLSVGDDEDVESEAKRRKKEVPVIESVLGSRAVREPRVVIQIESEIDILDDGYRWRKYGQKVVKGNPNPRSYYKCTSAGCGVRKHVERASHDLKCVITTYEGKHNHEVPVARNSSHATSGTVNLPPPPTNSQASSLALPRNPHPKSEPQDFIPPFEQKMKYNGDILGSNYLGSFRSSPFCALKFPALPNSMTYGPFGINPNNHCETSRPPLLPSVGNLPMSLPLTFPFNSNLGIGNYRSHSRPMNLVPPPFFPGPQMKEGADMKLLKPKQEHSIESYCDSNSLSYSSPKNSNGHSFLNHTV